MPKKTKNEKIAAQQKRIITSQSPSSQDHEKMSTHTIHNTVLKSKKPYSQQSFDPEQIKRNTMFFKADLKKSMIIIVSILAIEFGLYYASMQGFLNFF